MKKRAIVNYSDPQYKNGLLRLLESLRGFDTSTYDFFAFDHHDQLKCKPHSWVPYQFKPYAMVSIANMGYESILYLDASMYAIADPRPVFEEIEKTGYVLESCGANLGQFCTDLALQEFGIDRDFAMNIPMHSAGFTGLCVSQPKPAIFLENLFQFAKEEKTFKGPWTNENNQCSPDPRCKGHRHDQSVACYLAHKYGMEIKPPTLMRYGSPEQSDTARAEGFKFLAQGI